MQNLSNVILRGSRVVMWPNVFQKRLKPFEARSLQDPTLTPNRSEPAYFENLDGTMSASRLWAKSIRTSCARLWLPEENFSQIIEEVEDYPLSTKEGERMRQSFKEEREAFRERYTRAMKWFAKWDFWVEPGIEDEEDDGW